MSHRLERPNILWITLEDTSPRMGCYGDPLARTPNIDRLANEGTLYRNAYAVAGVCAPSRSAVVTGMYPTLIGTRQFPKR
ncbi:sulfatase-like hydrolase/transferase [Paenibacillus sp. J5C_2022]|uniref:sulfatase-like hydrolase/transferase n=1 Tax=Paenibacillus sp. J5C2022 TaxID=2977129 RepID=UPI0021D134FE|nr:sulfatase-like hydrolase/transferase [Paenibacillus sp. J5C2022]MCU6707759.1 sulfatase-like hydrolase/transferase [Paenibacillus sp. J5C2022]